MDHKERYRTDARYAEIYNSLSPGADYENYLATGEMPANPYERAGDWLVRFMVGLMLLAVLVALV